MKKFLILNVISIGLATLIFMPFILLIRDAGKAGESFIRANQAVKMRIGEIQKIKYKLFFDEMVFGKHKIRRWYECEGSIGTGTIGVNTTKTENGWKCNNIVLLQKDGKETELPLNEASRSSPLNALKIRKDTIDVGERGSSSSRDPVPFFSIASLGILVAGCTIVLGAGAGVYVGSLLKGDPMNPKIAIVGTLALLILWYAPYRILSDNGYAGLAKTLSLAFWSISFLVSLVGTLVRR